MEEVAESRDVREADRKKKPKKSKRPERPNKKSKSKNGERRRTSGKRPNGGVVTRTQCRSTDYTCLINAMTYLNLTKTQVTNYLKQQGRIVAANKTGEKKNGKKGIFAATAQRIIR